MRKKFNQVYQFKISLNEIKPEIWRRIHVPETYTFWDLHVAIQDAMGWLDYHLHEFEILSPSTGNKVFIGIPDEEFDEDREVLPGWAYKMADYFSLENAVADYRYDFGDFWEHKIKLEKILPREKSIPYPRCVAGKRACPPEDCGGVPGYEDFLQIIMDPQHEDYQQMLEWAGENLDPERFDPSKVRFDDPKKRFKIAMEISE